jgi:hypothetical protein
MLGQSATSPSTTILWILNPIARKILPLDEFGIIQTGSIGMKSGTNLPAAAVIRFQIKFNEKNRPIGLNSLVST